MKINTFLWLYGLSMTYTFAQETWNTMNELPTRLIGHRGERAFAIPEHSLAAYYMAIWEQADYVEPDLVMTKDHVLVCYHDLFLKSNTNVGDKLEFRDRMKNISIIDLDGSFGYLNATNDWIVADFTFEELSTLTLKVNVVSKKLNMRPPFFDNQFRIPSFQEYLDLVHSFSQSLNRKIGVIPELKHAAWHNQFFKSDNPFLFEDKFLEQLEYNGYPAFAESDPYLIIQNFEETSARYIRSQSYYYILQLIYGNVHFLTPKGLKRVSEYANATGAYKEFYTVGVENVLEYGVKDSHLIYDPIEIEKLGGFLGPDLLSRNIKQAGLEQIVYTLYSSFEPARSFCERMQGCPSVQDRRLELFYFFELGIDALFVENILEAQILRQEFNQKLSLKPVLSFARNSSDL